MTIEDIERKIEQLEDALGRARGPEAPALLQAQAAFEIARQLVIFNDLVDKIRYSGIPCS